MSAWGRRRWGGPFFEPSRPRAARGGIRARSKRGAFGESWWARRWISVLEGFNLGARLQRGRAYARSGQVLDIAVAKGRVAASVQGSRPQPYKVSVRVAPLEGDAWKRVARVLGREASFAARLLAGEMPHEVEAVFTEAGVSLFPQRSADLRTECSCPDWSNPCKHIAAVYYLLGEEFDRDPFLLFRLRGLEREELVALVGDGGTVRAAVAATEKDAAKPAGVTAGERLDADARAFWAGGEPPDPGEARLPELSAAPLRRLGAFPFWRAERGILEALEPAYVAAAARGVEVLVARGDAATEAPNGLDAGPAVTSRPGRSAVASGRRPGSA